MLPFRAASQPGLTVLAEMAGFMVRDVYIPEQLPRCDNPYRFTIFGRSLCSLSLF
jgi:hypothetical protein